MVEVISPDHTQQPDPAVFFIGSNALGETAPSFIMAAACNLNEPATFASIGFPEVHVVMTLFGDTVANCDDPCQPTCPPCACEFDTSSGPNVCDIFDFLAFQNGFVSGDPCAIDLNTTSGPGIGDIFDFLDFQDSFVAGPCP